MIVAAALVAIVGIAPFAGTAAVAPIGCACPSDPWRAVDRDGTLHGTTGPNVMLPSPERTALTRTRSALSPIRADVESALVEHYLHALARGAYADAYALLNADARRYYRSAANFQSIYAADFYRLVQYALLGSRADGAQGSVYFVRETARYRDFAHDSDLLVTATVPLGVIRDRHDWRIKDPGHPWRAFAAVSAGSADSLHVAVKKMSFFERRIEAVVTFTNVGSSFVTVLPYAKSIVHDNDGTPYRIIETRNWSLTDKTLFEGLRLAPNARYTGTLAFACDRRADAGHTYALTIAPAVRDGADAPISIDVTDIAPAATGSAPR